MRVPLLLAVIVFSGSCADSETQGNLPVGDNTDVTAEPVPLTPDLVAALERWDAVDWAGAIERCRSADVEPSYALSLAAANDAEVTATNWGCYQDGSVRWVMSWVEGEQFAVAAKIYELPDGTPIIDHYDEAVVERDIEWVSQYGIGLQSYYAWVQEDPSRETERVYLAFGITGGEEYVDSVTPRFESRGLEVWDYGSYATAFGVTTPAAIWDLIFTEYDEEIQMLEFDPEPDDRPAIGAFTTADGEVAMEASQWLPGHEGVDPAGVLPGLLRLTGDGIRIGLSESASRETVFRLFDEHSTFDMSPPRVYLAAEVSRCREAQDCAPEDSSFGADAYQCIDRRCVHAYGTPVASRIQSSVFSASPLFGRFRWAPESLLQARS